MLDAKLDIFPQIQVFPRRITIHRFTITHFSCEILILKYKQDFSKAKLQEIKLSEVQNKYVQMLFFEAIPYVVQQEEL